MYLTDGIHLYEVIDQVQNFGRLGGMFLSWCDDCDRYPSEGHNPRCRFVTVYGMPTTPQTQG